MKRLRAIKRSIRGSRRAHKRSRGPSEQVYWARDPSDSWHTRRSLAIMAWCNMTLLMNNPLKTLNAAGVKNSAPAPCNSGRKFQDGPVAPSRQCLSAKVIRMAQLLDNTDWTYGIACDQASKLKIYLLYTSPNCSETCSWGRLTCSRHPINSRTGETFSGRSSKRRCNVRSMACASFQWCSIHLAPQRDRLEI